MFKVVFDGGPCGGKTTVGRRLKEKYPSSIFVTPEVASGLTKELIPLPGRDVVLCHAWLHDFQTAVLPTQITMEKMWTDALRETATKLMIIDRGTLGGAAYFPGGLESFLKHFGLDLGESLACYDMVIHLETLAKSQPELFGKTDNEQRYETSPGQAIALDYLIQEIWQNHPNWHFIPSHWGIDTITDKIDELIQPYLTF
jgi:hypothetical protein